MKQIILASGLAYFFMTASPGFAGCISGIGCSNTGPIGFDSLYDATCADLWYLRNSALHENGFCFRNARGKTTFGNRTCFVKNLADVRMSAIERTNVKRIGDTERKRRCR